MKQNTTKFESKKLSRCRRRQKRRFDVFGEAIVDQHLPHADHFAAVGDQEIDGHLEKTGPVETLFCLNSIFFYVNVVQSKDDFHQEVDNGEPSPPGGDTGPR